MYPIPCFLREWFFLYYLFTNLKVQGFHSIKYKGVGITTSDEQTTMWRGSTFLFYDHAQPATKQQTRKEEEIEDKYEGKKGARMYEG